MYDAPGATADLFLPRGTATWPLSVRPAGHRLSSLSSVRHHLPELSCPYTERASSCPCTATYHECDDQIGVKGSGRANQSNIILDSTTNHITIVG